MLSTPAQTATTLRRTASERSSGDDRSAMLGLSLLLLSEFVLFAAFIAQYLASRILAPQWPPQGFPRIPAAPTELVLTILLVISTYSAHNGRIAARTTDRDALTGWLILTIALGVAFLGGQLYEFSVLVGEGIGINNGIYGTSFYSLAILHAVHLVVGLGVLGVVLVRAFLGHFRPLVHFAVDGAVLFWEFLGLTWLAIFVIGVLL